MSNMLKCPNSTCPYVFDPSQVPVGVVLSCPRCGMQFTLGAPALTSATTTAPPPGYTAAPSGYGAPAAPPPAATNPDFEAVGRTAVEERDPDAPLPGHRANKAQVFILAGIAAVLMAGTALTIVFKFTHREGDAPADDVTRLPDLNVRVDPLPPGWTRDDSLRVTLGPPFVMSYKRDSPEAYMAFGSNRPPGDDRSPRPSVTRRSLKKPFPKLFNLSTVREEPPLETKWMGETIAPDHGFRFRAQSNEGLIWVGEAYAVAHQGIAYYWMSWSGENDFDGLKGEFAAARGKFKFLEMRKDWKPRQSNVTDFKGDKVPYTVSDAEELWKEVAAEEYAALKTAEPDLDRRLRLAFTPEDDRKARPDTAEMSVYVLDGGGDPLQVARKYAEDMETARIKGAGGDYTLTFKELTDAVRGDPIQTAIPATTPSVRLESNVKESRDSARLIVVSGIAVGNKTVAVLCWCEYRKRDVFEATFVQIASSLR